MLEKANMNQNPTPTSSHRRFKKKKIFLGPKNSTATQVSKNYLIQLPHCNGSSSPPLTPLLTPHFVFTSLLVAPDAALCPTQPSLFFPLLSLKAFYDLLPHQKIEPGVGSVVESAGRDCLLSLFPAALDILSGS